MKLEAADFSESPFLAPIQIWVPLQMAQAYNAKLVKFSAVHVGAVLKHIADLSGVRSSPEFADVVTNIARDQFDSLTEQINELSAFTENVFSENGEMVEPTFWD